MYLELAQKYLQKARMAVGSSKKYFANLCQVCLAKQGATPFDIGSTPQELSKMQDIQEKNNPGTSTQKMQVPLETCKKYLTQCRNASGASRQYYANLCISFLAKFSIEPQEINCSMQELYALQNKGFLESAINYLLEARNATGTRQKCYADLCWDYLGKAKATPENIGSSEEELNRMSH